MATYENMNAELNCMKEKFMQLDTDEARAAFHSEMEKFVASKNEQEQKLIGEAFLNGAKEACQRVDGLMDDILRIHLENIYDAISWAYIARHYFGKSRAWFNQRVNGLKVHNTAVRFTDAEKKILLNALLDLSGRIKNTAQVIEHL